MPDLLYHSQMTPAFITSILRTAGDLQAAMVTAVAVEALNGAGQFNAQVVRLHLTYDRDVTTAPRSLIVKLPTFNTALQQNAAVFQPGIRESWFYSYGAAHTPVDTPRCYYHAVDGTTGQSCLVLQDLAPARSGDRLAGATLGEAQLAMQALSRLHAAWWGFGPDAAPELLPLLDDAKAGQDLVVLLYRQAWPQLLGRTDIKIPEDRCGQDERSGHMEIEPIRNEVDHAATLKEITNLLASSTGTLEGDRMEGLVTLVEAYEAKHFPIAEPDDPVGVLEYYLESRGLSRSDLIKYMGSKERPSEVLNRKRSLSLAMIRRLHLGLGIPTDLLL